MAKRKTRASWLPTGRGKEWEKRTGAQHMRPGQPFDFELVREGNEEALRGYGWTWCCDCDLRHFESFEVFRTKEGKFTLRQRSWRDDTATRMARDKRKVRKL